jgi:hypothetical protein
MHFSLFKFILVLHSVLLFWKLMLFRFLLSYITDLPLLNAYSSSKYYFPARRSQYANADCTEVYVLLFGTKTVSLNHILQWYFLVIKTTVFSVTVTIHMFVSHRTMIGVTALLIFYYGLNDTAWLVLFFVSICEFVLFPSLFMLAS